MQVNQFNLQQVIGKFINSQSKDICTVLEHLSQSQSLLFLIGIAEIITSSTTRYSFPCPAIPGEPFYPQRRN
jgi:hypothetical protein